MARSITQNRYSEEFKKNTVAVIRAGLSLRSTAKRLSIPVNTVSYWVSQDKYRDVCPASEEVLKALPKLNSVKKECKPTLVPITAKERVISTSNNPVKINYGKLSIEFSKGLTAEDLKIIIQAFGGKDVL